MAYTLKDFGYKRRLPKAHKQEGYMVGGNKGFTVAAYPRNYPMTSTQRRVKEAAKACGIRKGMTRKALMDAMITCIPGKF